MVAAVAAELTRQAVEREHAAQKPEELELLALWCHARGLAPDVVLEVGVYLGGTLWLWRELWPLARIVGVDLNYPPCESCGRRRAHRDCPVLRVLDAIDNGGALLLGDSHELETRDRVRWELAPAGECDFLHIDGDHSYEGVRADFELYAPLVRSGGAIVLHDVAGDAFPGCVRFWRELEEVEPDAFLILEGRRDWGGLGVVPR